VQASGCWTPFVASWIIVFTVPDQKPYKPPYAFSVTIGENCARQMRTFADLAEKLNMPVEDLMRQCNGKVSPSKALVKGWRRNWASTSHTSRGLPRKCGRILLLAQRDSVPKDSPQKAVLDSEITTLNDVVGSYRIVKALE
jgi:hypothetical protein